MNKLIELLNEYDKINKHINKWFRDEYWHLNREYGWSTVASSCWKVISKSYGFIKWLVDNDKIDFGSENYPLKKYYPYFSDDILAIVGQDCNTYEDRCKVCYDKYESLLMLLAIQDSPLDFLISILK